MTAPTPKFALGRCVATPAALKLLAELNLSPIELLVRHHCLDNGCLDAGDIEANVQALKSGARLFSAFEIGDGLDKFYVITEAVNDDGHRFSTCLMTPSDY